MTVNGGQETGLFFVYGWRTEEGPFYVAGDVSREQAIEKARAVVRRWKRVVVDNVRTNERVWDSLPAASR